MINVGLPEDVYVLQVVGFQDKESEHTGNSYRMVTFRVISGPYSGNLLYKPLANSPAARWAWEDWIETPDNNRELLGRVALAQVSSEVYDGVERNKVHKLFRMPEGLIVI